MNNNSYLIMSFEFDRTMRVGFLKTTHKGVGIDAMSIESYPTHRPLGWQQRLRLLAKAVLAEQQRQLKH